MHKGLAFALAAAVLLLAGCSAPAATSSSSSAQPVSSPSSAAGQASSTTAPASAPSSAPPAPSRMSIHGVVVDEALRPLSANVTLVEKRLVEDTGPSGAFRFDNLAPNTYALQVSAPGYHAQTVEVGPDQANQEVRIQLEVDLASGQAFNQTVHFRGFFECALEALIISPACDTLSPMPVFNTTNVATIDVQNGWKTEVTDVVFDTSSQPLLAGLRVTVQGTHNQSSLGTYQQYGRFDGAQSFTFGIEPGGTYLDGTGGPVPTNTTAFRFTVYPQSLGWHAVCVPPGSTTCFLGVGAGTNISFDLYMTTFYGQSAPDGFTLRHG